MAPGRFIYNPQPELRPDLKLSPFTNRCLVKNYQLPESTVFLDYLDGRFGRSKWKYTNNGRTALNNAIGYYQPTKDDVITIFTSTGNSYVSRCVTNEIEKYCKWSLKMEISTRLILVIHDFGIPFKGWDTISTYNLPIIEDCAYAFLNGELDKSTGNYGDFSVFSFPKFFPVQCGGLLLSNRGKLPGENISGPIEKYLNRTMSHYILEREEIAEKRRSNFQYYEKLFLGLDLASAYTYDDQGVPGVFMFRTNLKEEKLQQLKEFLYKQGIECSVFYGLPSFFIPVHQNLATEEADYIFGAVKQYLQE